MSEPTGKKSKEKSTPETWAEAKLMGPLRTYLTHTFMEELELPTRHFYYVQDTSRMGPVMGRWARPDFVVIAAAPFKVLPGCQFDVYSFELKTETGASGVAVYEALSQTRFAHFGYLVWHLPKNSPAQKSRFAEIEAQCIQHGIGLILMREPEDPDSYEAILQPARKQAAACDVDDFLETRLGKDDQMKLRKILNGAPA